MSRSMSRLGLLLLSILAGGALLQLPNPAWATTDLPVYVAADGSGSVCSAAAPCSISGAQAKVRTLIAGSGTGDVQVYVTGGTYSLSSPVTFGPADSGTSTRQVVWQAASGATPLFTGAVSVTGWTAGSNGIWSAPAPSGITSTRQLYVNGERATLARSRNLPAFTTTAGSGVFTIPHATMPISNFKNITDVEGVFRSTFITGVCPIATVIAQGANDVVAMAEPCWREADIDGKFATHADVVGFLQNAYELLDSPGEWYFDRTGAVAGDQVPRFYYKPKTGQNLTDTTVTVPGVQQLLNVAGTVAGNGTVTRVHDLKFVGLNFADSTWQLPVLTDTMGIDDAPRPGGVTYSGSGWTAQRGIAGQHNQTQTVTQTDGDSFTLTFTGTRVDFISAQASNRGSFDYQIDGGTTKSGTCAASVPVNQQPCLIVTGLSNTQHTLKVTKTGGSYLSLDELRAFTSVSDEDDSVTGTGGITYTGSGWTPQTGITGQLNQTQTYTTTNGDSTSYTFNGGAIDLISTRDTNRGTFSYTIDGGAPSAGTCYWTSRIDGTPCVSVGDLGPGQHTITVTKTGGTYLSLDAFRVSTAPTPSSPGFVEQQSDVIITGSTQMCDLSHQVPTPAAVDIAYASNITFQGNTISRVGQTGLAVEHSSNNITVVGNEIFDGSANGISIGGVSVQDQRPAAAADEMHDVSVQDNYVHNIAREFYGGVGIWAGFVDTLTVQHNEIAHVPYSGISIGWGWRLMDQGETNLSDPYFEHATYCPPDAELATHTTATSAKNQTVSYNYIHDFMENSQDGGAIYTLGAQPGSLIQYNRLESSPTDAIEATIYNDNGSTGWTVDYNFISHTQANYLTAADASPANTAHDNSTSWTAPPGGLTPQQVIDQAGLESGYTGLHHGASTTNLAIGAAATATSASSGYGAGNAVDGDTTTRWVADAAATTATVTLNFPTATTLNRVSLQEYQQNGLNAIGKINAYTVKYLDPNNVAQVAASGIFPAATQDISFGAVTTRQLQFTIDDSAGGPGIDEIGVYDDGGSDLATGGTADQSSTGYSGVAARAIDGITDGNWNNNSVTSTNLDTNAWWRVDLGGVKAIGRINVFNRSDYGDRLSDYWVFVSSKQFDTSLTPVAQSHVPGVWSSHQTSQAASPTALPVHTAGRYVMVQLSGANYLSLAEVQVIAGTP